MGCEVGGLVGAAVEGIGGMESVGVEDLLIAEFDLVGLVVVDCLVGLLSFLPVPFMADLSILFDVEASGSGFEVGEACLVLSLFLEVRSSDSSVSCLPDFWASRIEFEASPGGEDVEDSCLVFAFLRGFCSSDCFGLGSVDF